MKYKNLRSKWLNWRWRSGFVLLLTLLGLAWAEEAKASHAAGADITYECVGTDANGNNRYVFRLSFYNDCEGINAPTSVNFNINSESCGLTVPTVTVQQDVTGGGGGPTGNGIEVSGYCDSLISSSSCNGGLLPGIEVYTYTSDTITLPAQCTDWRISYSLCCRNPIITNLVNPDTDNIYVEAIINNTGGICSSSPTFLANPVPFICAGQFFTYNHGASDPDGDSLLFELITPLTGYVGGGTYNTMTYSPGFSANFPVSTGTNPADSFQFSTNTGQMSFTPNVPQVTVVAVRVSQIRNGVVIGSNVRDMQVIVLANANCTQSPTSAPPVINSGGLIINESLVLCQSDTVLFFVEFLDPDGDTLSLDLSNTNLGQVFPSPPNFLQVFPQTIPGRPDSLAVFIAISASQSGGINLGSNTITVGVTDGACPIPGNNVLALNILIPGVNVTASDTTICPGIAQNIQLFSNATTAGVGANVQGSFQWNQLSGPPAPVTNDTIADPILQVPGNTVDGQDIVYEVVYTTVPDSASGTTCVARDSITISLRTLPLSVDLQASDVTLCPNGLPDSVLYSVDISGPGVDTINGVYTWTANPTTRLSDLSSTSIGNPIGAHVGLPNDSMTYTLSYAYGACVGSDDITLNFNAATISTAGDSTVCPGDSAFISVAYNSLAAANSGVCGPTTEACNGAPGVFQVGTGTNPSPSTFTSSTPFQGYWHDGRMQILYRASELIAAGVTPGKISEIAFDVVQKGSTQPYAGYTVRMGCVSINQMTPGVFQPTGGLTTVFNGTVNTTVGWNTLTLQTEYEWDGNSSLLVEICHDNSSFTNSDPVNYSITPFSSVVYDYTDGSTGCTLNTPSSFLADNERPNIRFTSCVLAPDVTYQWTPTLGLGDATAAATGAAPQNTTTYVVVGDDGECALTDSVTVTVLPGLPTPTVTCGTPQFPSNSVLFEWGNVPGANGWEYSLDSGVTWTFQPLADSSYLVTGLTAGDSFTIYVRATGGSGACPNNASTIFTCATTFCQPTLTTVLEEDISCNGADDGVISILATGGDAGAPYSFTLYNDTSNAVVAGPLTSNDTLSFTNLMPGDYYIVVLDSVNCIDTTTVFNITQPDPLVATIPNTTLTTCYNSADGSATAGQTGGTAPFSYQWDALAFSQTTATATGLAVGAYNVTVTDANGCESTIVANVTSEFTQAPIVDAAGTDATSCNPGDGQVFIQSYANISGTPNPGQANSITFQWTNQQTGAQFSGNTVTGLEAGTYSVSVVDGNGNFCGGVDTVTIGGPSVQVFASGTDPNCGIENGTVTVDSVVGGTAPFSYEWILGATTVGTTPSVNNLAGGTYSISLTDANGCSSTASVTLTDSIIPQLTVANNSNLLLACHGDTDGAINLTVNPAGIAANTSFTWSTGETTQSISGLAAGTYAVTASFNGCVAELFNVEVREPQAPFATDGIVTLDNTCENPTQGTIELANTDGWGNYSYVLSSNPNDTLTANPITGLAGGEYTITVLDQNAEGDYCPIELTDTLSEPFVPTLAPWIQQVGQTSASVILGETLDANAGADQTINGVTYTWTVIPASSTGGLNNNNTPGVFIDTDGLTGTSTQPVTLTYLVTATSSSDPVCTVEDSVTLTITPTGFTGMPNIFSPNGDEANDRFAPVELIGAQVLQFKIYNRWGQVVYDDPEYRDGGWDGTVNGEPQNRDVYIYVLEYQFPGEPVQVERGEVTLLR